MNIDQSEMYYRYYVYQLIWLNKLYKLMCSFYQISESFFELFII